ncbi:hypothetical protein M9H77_12487 [Catharanthus roseus]|uniref:Uncharacterized protein n=1 Tax=Catharanthus roseus TaxID=4058 RepID=A0ACC0BHP7_CATRO|nr:hypothetical protein M9H77_12487 [Catharanthus roseus]
MAGIMFVWAMYQNYFPCELRGPLKRYGEKLKSIIYPYIQITFHEYQGDGFDRSKAYMSVGRYLDKNSSKQAKRLKATVVQDSESIVLSMQDHEEITDECQGIKLWWASSQDIPIKKSISFYPREDEKRRLRLGKDRGSSKRIIRTRVGSDLGEIGKAWKRGYLLYGPPGTGKSSMIVAMANLLKYDVYGLELTAVKDNTELRKLLIEISPKSIVVIEDIDCSLDLTGQRENKKKEEKKEEEKPDKEMKKKIKESSNKESTVTLSGLLKFIDSLWSACGGESLIVFTTNYVEKLDPALIRRGRMDKHIELSYCGFEAFKVLAKNYLNIDSHNLFGTIGRLLEETNMTSTDAENLMPKSSEDDEEICLERLIEAIEMAKEEAARLKAEEEEKERLKKAEEEEKQRAMKE